MMISRIANRAPRNDAGVALMMSLMVIVLASTLSLAVAAGILAQVKPTHLNNKLTLTASGAEGGIDLAQKRVRDGERMNLLPCGPFTGNTTTAITGWDRNDEAGGAIVEGGKRFSIQYEATVAYYAGDPAGRPKGWLDAHKITCPSGGLEDLPKPWWAVLTSTGELVTLDDTKTKYVPEPPEGNRTFTATLKSGTAPPKSRGFVAGQSGDGWEALFHGKNIYNVYHHYPLEAKERGRMLDCNSKTSGKRCKGWTAGGMYASSQPGKFNTGPDDLFTALHNRAAIETGSDGLPTGKVYVAAGRDLNEIGVVCLNLPAQESCGFTKLATSPVDHFEWINQVVGGAQVGTQYFIGGPGAKIYCFDYALAAACSGFPAGGLQATSFANNPGGALEGYSGVAGSLESFDGRYVFGVLLNSTDSPNKDLICLDASVSTNIQPCAGSWPKQSVTAHGESYNSTMAPLLDPAGELTGICVSTAPDRTATPYKCFSLSGASEATPAWSTEGAIGNTQDGVVVVGARVYFAHSLGAIPGKQGPGTARYTCWDFATGAACAGFAPSTSGKVVRPYTLRQDPYDLTCIWEAGDAGIFEIFHRDTGEINEC